MTKNKLTNNITIDIYQQDWIPGFAAFIIGSLNGKKKKLNKRKNAGNHAQVVLNVGAVLAAVAEKDFKPKEVPYIVAECLMHEVIHVLEEWANVEFSEKKVAELILNYQQYYKNNQRRCRRTLGK